MTPVTIQAILGFVTVVVALIGTIYRLFNSTIQLKIEAVNKNTATSIEVIKKDIEVLKKDLGNDLNNGLNKLHMEIELCRHEKKFLEAIIKDHVTFNTPINTTKT